jgi:hypothetical protein
LEFDSLNSSGPDMPPECFDPSVSPSTRQRNQLLFCSRRIAFRDEQARRIH